MSFVNICFPDPGRNQCLPFAWSPRRPQLIWAPMPETRTRILVVDDDLRLRDLLQRYLTEQGFAVSTVSDASGMDRLRYRERSGPIGRAARWEEE